MTKRFGRTVVSRTNADAQAFNARCVGADRSPLSGNCESPVIVPITGLADKVLSRLNQFEGNPQIDFAPGHGMIGRWQDLDRVQHVDLEVRCRVCPACKRARAAHWRMRALAELSKAERSWFGTMTLAPEHLFRIESAAAIRLWRGGTNWADLSEPERFYETCRELTKEFQLYMKRLRKRASGLRFMAVFEPHKSGAPHMHMFLHETAGPIRHARLSAAWRLGFVKFKLVDETETKYLATYVAKYLTKTLSHRVLSSKRYGRED